MPPETTSVTPPPPPAPASPQGSGGHPPRPPRAAPPRLAKARYRVWQFWRSLTARGLDADDHTLLAQTLSPAARALFATMSLNDQRHSLTVYHALWARGCRDHDLLVAALLHDCGKGAGRVRLWVRPAVVLLHAATPGLLRWLARAPGHTAGVPFWRRPFYAAWHHPEIGAALAEQAGVSARSALFIRTHHLPTGPAAALHAVDDAL